MRLELRRKWGVAACTALLRILRRKAFGDRIRRCVAATVRDADVHRADAGLFEGFPRAAAEGNRRIGDPHLFTCGRGNLMRTEEVK